MGLQRWFNSLSNSKSIFNAFLVVIYTASIIFVGVIWPAVHESRYVEEKLSQLLKYERKQLYRNSLSDSNLDDLSNLVAERSIDGHNISFELCPETPPGLVGKLNISIKNLKESVTNEASLARVVYGGRYQPDCIARERTAIIIPYRDRAEHLDILTRHLHNILQRQQLQYRIFVIEIALPTQFNRGLLANIGVVVARESSNFSCYIIHDVDSLMMNDENLYRCGSQPRHLVTGNTKYATKDKEYGLPYKLYMSGVIALTDAQYNKANGFSNVYFGWGGEDDDFNVRVAKVGMRFVRPQENVGLYMAIPHENDSSNPINPARRGTLRSAAVRQKIEGISSFYKNKQKINYKRYAIEYRQYYTWVLIGVNEAGITQQFEKYMGAA
ncbi:hypothetical protein ACJMK2_024680 [Sinanodonta woodiana]|uniref:Beta-1,4-galactosyltransferase n=1 Tax=Sinanodonta woodiana TaxID=1069815 RepID=A0ABD3XG28_SINWO